jgi:dTDP-4-dehydrorhamnose reductase
VQPTRPGAANRFPEKVDADPAGTRALNIEASRALGRLCAARGIFLLYISTDYVFAGRPGEAPYEADAATGPTNLYGQTKLDGEAAVLGETRPGWGAVMRVPVLYGSVAADKGNGESAVNCLMDVVMKSQDQGGKKVKMDHWALRYPTNTEDVGRVCYGEFSYLPGLPYFCVGVCLVGYGLAD